MLPPTSFMDRVARHPWIAKWGHWSQHAHIGRAALDRSTSGPRPGFTPTFKAWLGRAPLSPLARRGEHVWTAREVAEAYLRELIHACETHDGSQVRDLVITVPVGSFEAYRAELRRIAKRLGVKNVRFVDEPVAAALGYGLSVGGERPVMVVDFGAGTLDVAVVLLSASGASAGVARVVGKAGRPLGGYHVDKWILEYVCRQLDVPYPKDPLWQTIMLDEARRVKEEVYTRETCTFVVAPPSDLDVHALRGRNALREVPVSREDLDRIVRAHGLHDIVRSAVDEALGEAAQDGMRPDALSDVLMVGGSTLLPGVYSTLEAQFGRDRVRAWQPFEAVGFGASILAAGALRTSDVLAHDYAILTHDRDTQQPRLVRVVTRGTRIPTSPTHWSTRLVPTCSLGEPENTFQLVVYEVGHAMDDERLFGWDATGRLHVLHGGDEGLAVPLNETAPTLGRLEPPHPPDDLAPRLQVAFGVDSDRWLIATVDDLKTSKRLLDGEPVVRLV
jgi:molecular chaperone DnaK (HSP70)